MGFRTVYTAWAGSYTRYGDRQIFNVKNEPAPEQTPHPV